MVFLSTQSFTYHKNIVTEVMIINLVVCVYFMVINKQLFVRINPFF